MNWLRNFMAGRYGFDQLSIAIFILYVIVWFVERLFGLWWLMFVTAALIIWMFFRILSRNHRARQAENAVFLRIWSPIVAWWQNRGIRKQGRDQKTAEKAARKQWHKPPQQKNGAPTSAPEEDPNYRLFQCALCGQTLRVPRGKGKVNIRCPKCGNEFTERT